MCELFSAHTHWHFTHTHTHTQSSWYRFVSQCEMITKPLVFVDSLYAAHVHHEELVRCSVHSPSNVSLLGCLVFCFIPHWNSAFLKLSLTGLLQLLLSALKKNKIKSKSNSKHFISCQCCYFACQWSLCSYTSVWSVSCSLNSIWLVLQLIALSPGT